MKSIDVIKYDTGYGWKEPPDCNCIMAVYDESLGGTVNDDDLREMVNDGVINEVEYDAISEFDMEQGDDKELEIIKSLAKDLGMDIMIKNAQT